MLSGVCHWLAHHSGSYVNISDLRMGSFWLHKAYQVLCSLTKGLFGHTVLVQSCIQAISLLQNYLRHLSENLPFAYTQCDCLSLMVDFDLSQQTCLVLSAETRVKFSLRWSTLAIKTVFPLPFHSEVLQGDLACCLQCCSTIRPQKAFWVYMAWYKSGIS